MKHTPHAGLRAWQTAAVEDDAVGVVGPVAALDKTTDDFSTFTGSVSSVSPQRRTSRPK